MKPELPTTGSKMTPAISSLLASKVCLTLSRSLYVAVRVAAAPHTAQSEMQPTNTLLAQIKLVKQNSSSYLDSEVYRHSVCSPGHTGHKQGYKCESAALA